MVAIAASLLSQKHLGWEGLPGTISPPVLSIGSIAFFVQFLFHSWGNSCYCCCCLSPASSPALSEHSTEAQWHRPGSSMGQKQLVFTGVGKAPLHRVTHWFARVGAHSGVKSQALGGDTCARNLPKSFHTPCQPGNSCLRVHFSVASPRNLLLYHDDTRFHQPHDVPAVSAALAAHVSMNKDPWTLHNHPHQSRARRGRCIPSSSCGDKTVPAAQQGHPCQDTAQSHCLYKHIPSFSLIEDKQCSQQTP